MATLRIEDDRKRELILGRAPRRIVSLVPSDTLSVAALGCGDALVGCTDYCELPTERVRELPKVGGTKNPRIDAILALEPDLVLANQEENSRSDLERLVAERVPVLIAFPRTVAQGLAGLARLARVLRVEREPAVRALIGRGYQALQHAEREAAERPAIAGFCPIWMKPLMTINEQTYISDMLRLCGVDNVFAERERLYPLAADIGRAEPMIAPGRDVRYPRVTIEEVCGHDPKLVLLPSEPHPFSDADAAEIASWPSQHPTGRTLLPIDGKDVCWYGARAIDGLPRLRAAIAEALGRRS